MAKQRIHSFGGRSHSTPFTRGGEGLNYVSRQVVGAYAAIANAITGTMSGVAYFDSTSSITSSPSFIYKDQESLYIIGALSATNAYTTILTPTTDDELASKYYVDQQVGGHNGTVSGISYFNTATSVTSDPDFGYDTSTHKMFVTSASVSSVQIHRDDYITVSNESVLRNLDTKTPIWDNPYFSLGNYKCAMIEKEIYDQGTNYRTTGGILYSDWSILRAVTYNLAGIYNYIEHWANYGTGIDIGGLRCVRSNKRSRYKQLTSPVIGDSLSSNHRVYFGLSDDPLNVVNYDASSIYNTIAFKFTPAVSQNWYAFTSNGANATSVDTGIAYNDGVTGSKAYLLKISIEGFVVNFYINNVHVAQISQYIPSDSTNLYAMNLIKNTNTATSVYKLGISHLHMVMT